MVFSPAVPSAPVDGGDTVRSAVRGAGGQAPAGAVVVAGDVERAARTARARAERFDHLAQALSLRAARDPVAANALLRAAHVARREAQQWTARAARHDEAARWLRRAARSPGPL
jgi:hypothetical protein